MVWWRRAHCLGIFLQSYVSTSPRGAQNTPLRHLGHFPEILPRLLRPCLLQASLSSPMCIELCLWAPGAWVYLGLYLGFSLYMPGCLGRTLVWAGPTSWFLFSPLFSQVPPPAIYPVVSSSICSGVRPWRDSVPRLTCSCTQLMVIETLL